MCSLNVMGSKSNKETLQVKKWNISSMVLGVVRSSSPKWILKTQTYISCVGPAKQSQGSGFSGCSPPTSILGAIDLPACHHHFLSLIRDDWAVSSCSTCQKRFLCHTQVSFSRKAMSLAQNPVWKLPLLYIWDRREKKYLSPQHAAWALSWIRWSWNTSTLLRSTAGNQKVIWSHTKPRQLHYHNAGLHTEWIRK